MISAPVYCRRFVGRREQLDALEARFRACRDEKAGSIVLISGEAGIGKTRLVREFCERLEADGLRAIVAPCLEYASSPYAPFTTALAALINGLPSQLTLSAESREALGHLLPQFGEAQRSQKVVDKLSLFAAFAEAFLQFAATSPLTIVIDDLHWADAGSLEFLQYLATRISVERVLLMATYRAEELEVGHPVRTALLRLQREPCVWRLQLEPLNDDEMGTFIREALLDRATISPLVAQSIRTECEGNPLNAEELLKSAVDNASQDLAEIALPQTLTESVIERLGRLTEVERSIVLCAAAIGRRFTAQFLAQTLERPFSEIVAALKKAIALQLLVEETHEEIAYAFRHALTRDAICSQLLAIEARPLHAKIARALESNTDSQQHSAELAYHFWEARELTKAARYNELTADAAVSVYAYRDAIVAYERALEATGSLGLPKADLQMKLAAAFFEAGETHRAGALYLTAAAQYEAASDCESAARAYISLSRERVYMAETDTAREYAQKAAELAPRDSAVYFDAQMSLVYHFIEALEISNAAAALSSLEASAARQNPRRLAHYERLRGILAALIDDAPAAKIHRQRCAQIARELSDYQFLANIYNNDIVICKSIGEREHILQTARQLEDLLHSVHLGESSRAWGWMQAASTYMWFGLLEESRRCVLLALAHQTEERLSIMETKSVGIEVGVLLKDDELIHNCYDSDFVHFLRDHPNQHWATLDAVCAAVRLAEATRKIDEIKPLIHAALQDLKPIWLPETTGMLCYRTARYGDPRDIPTARRCLANVTRNTQTRQDRAFVALFDAAVADREGNAKRAREQAEIALALLTEIEVLPVERGFALEALGRYEEALELYRSIGDRYDSQRIEKHLTVVNKRGRAKGDLTSREGEIAELVAQGHSNAAIAEELVISARTVEHHVAAILDKLGMRTRTEIAAYVARSKEKSGV